MQSKVFAFSIAMFIPTVVSASPTKQFCKSTTKEIVVCIEEPNVYGRVALNIRGINRFLSESSQVGIYKDDHYSFDGTSVEMIESGEVVGVMCEQATPGFCR
jgi:hypothetical protein